MHPVWHALTSTAIAGGWARWRGRFPWAWWLASVLVDADHFLWYGTRTGDWHPVRVWRGIHDENVRQGARDMPLHRWPVILVLLGLALRHRPLRAWAVGLLTHRLLDTWSRWWPRRVYHRRRRRYARLWAQVAARQGRRCAWCGTAEGALELHHRRPRWAGGQDNADNLVLLCPPCHRRAHGREKISQFTHGDAPSRRV